MKDSQNDNNKLYPVDPESNPGILLLESQAEGRM